MSAPRTSRVLDGLLGYRVEGDGEPLLLLNGGMMSLSAWGTFAVSLAQEYRLVRCDLRGQLLSPGPPHPSLAGHADDLVRLLDALKIGTAHVLGASFGGEVGLILAAQHPKRVSSLLAVTAVDRFTAESLRGVDAMTEACRQALAGGDRGAVYDLIVVDTFSREWSQAHREELNARRAQVGLLPDRWFEGLVGLLDNLRTFDLTEQLGSIVCPTLVIAAGDDAVMPLPRSRALAERIAGAKFAVIPGSGHGLILERPEALLALCRAFLAEQTNRSGDGTGRQPVTPV